MQNVMLAAMVAVSAFVVAQVLRSAVRVRMKVTPKFSFHDLRELTLRLNERIAEHMRANFSGDPAQLDGAVRELVPMARELARTHGHALDDGILKMLIASCIAGQRFATRGQAEAALDAVFSEERRAA